MARHKGPLPAPTCFTQAQWDYWKEGALVSPTSPHHGFCEDCLPTFKLKNLAAGMCQHPGVKFTFHPIKGITGRRPHTDLETSHV